VLFKIEKIEMGGHEAHMRKGKDVYRVLVGKLKERDQLEDPGLDGSVILRWIFRKWDVGLWTGKRWLRKWTIGRQL
jgi:hypothetical protein